MALAPTARGIILFVAVVTLALHDVACGSFPPPVPCGNTTCGASSFCVVPCCGGVDCAPPAPFCSPSPDASQCGDFPGKLDGSVLSCVCG